MFSEQRGSGCFVSGAGGLYPSELCGLKVLYSCRNLAVKTLASKRALKIFEFKSSSIGLAAARHSSEILQ
jgi:hypothetical protein